MNWLFYLLEANVVLLFFYGFYRLFLRAETFYSANRYYLLITGALAFVLPLFKLGWFKPDVVLQQINYPSTQVSGPLPVVHVPTSQYSPADIALILYLIIAGAFAVKFFLKLYGIVKVIRRNSIEKVNGVNMVALPGTKASFSFLNYLFIDPELTEAGTIFRHEKAHINHFHTLDILFLEVLQIVNWFNPFMILVKKDVKALHEFIADAETLDAGTDAEKYAMFLIRYSSVRISQPLASQMFSTQLLKNRITRLYQEPSRPASKLKYCLVLPLVVLIMCVSSVAYAKSYGIELFPAKVKYVSAVRQKIVNNEIPDADKEQPIQQPSYKRIETLRQPTTQNLPEQTDPQVVELEEHPIFNIDARTDTVSISRLMRKGSAGFDGIFVIDGKVYTATELAAAMDANGKLKIIMSSRPIIGMYTPNDADAIKQWGERARNGVMFVTPRDAITNTPPD